MITREAYGQYLRGYATAAFKPFVLPRSTLRVVIEDDPKTDAFIVKISASGRQQGGYGPCPFFITLEIVSDNRSEEQIDKQIAQWASAMNVSAPAAGQAEERFPVSDAIAAMRTGAPYIGGDRH